jgi:hypothetical protein
MKAVNVECPNLYYFYSALTQAGVRFFRWSHDWVHTASSRCCHVRGCPRRRGDERCAWTGGWLQVSKV